MTPDKLEIKKEMLPDYQLKVANEHNIPIKKLFPNFFDREKYVFHCATFNFMQD